MHGKLKHLIDWKDWGDDEVRAVLDLARKVKHRRWEYQGNMQGNTLVMIFQKTSTRTRVSFEAGMTELGGHAINLDWRASNFTLSKVGYETRYLCRNAAMLMARLKQNSDLMEMEAAATVPLINGCCNLYHPCQAMADLVTVAGVMKPQDATLAYVGDGNNVAHSLILLSAVLGLRLRIATPASHPPAARVMARARGLAAASGAEIELHEDPFLAVEGVNFVYTDVWTSMGQEAEAEQRRRIFRPYQVNADLMSRTANAWLLHCLPAHRGEEVTDDVLEGPRSLVFDQAENRLHAQNAILERLLAAG